RLERGLFVLHTEPVDLSVLAHEVAQSLGKQGVPLIVDVQATDPEALVIQADPERLRQALENVVGNAIKHSEEGTPVTITLDTEPPNGADAEQGRARRRWAILDVADQGPGVPPEVLPHLFTKFASGPGSSGLGLGLYLASRIAAAHGGTLTVDSTPGKGARFRFALPPGKTTTRRAPLS
ncbi:MAG TPA: ATP-binding protein, partial [Chloroflexota bacterium]|nr:ATP-binding protein [Chloroflexota bacterium]